MIFDKKVFLGKVDILLNKLYLLVMFSGLVIIMLNIITYLVAWYFVAELDWNIVKTLISYYLIVSFVIYLFILTTKLNISLVLSAILNIINMLLVIVTLIYSGDYFIIAYIVAIVAFIIRIAIVRRKIVLGKIFEEITIVYSDSKSKWNYLPIGIILLRFMPEIFTDFPKQDIELFIMILIFYTFNVLMSVSMIGTCTMYRNVINKNFNEYDLNKISFLTITRMKMTKKYSNDLLVQYLDKTAV
jgi:hypothetical protein